MKLAAVAGAILGFAALLISTVALSQSGRSASDESEGLTDNLAGQVGSMASMQHASVTLGDIFIEPGTINLAAGQIMLDVTNSGGIQHDLALEDGHRFEGRMGQDDWKRMRFERNEIALTAPTGEATDSSEDHAKASLALAQSRDPAARAALAWRISVPVSVLVLALLAVALSRQNPREARYGRLLIAILVYLLYANVLALVRAGIVQGHVPAWLGLWWVHALAAALGAWIVWRQYHVGKLPVRTAA